MTAERSNMLEFENRDQWRGWLEHNHAEGGQAWVRIFKQKYRHQGLALEEAVEEAVCFGWIDSVMQPVDERMYALRFTPRTSTSTWSMSNIQRVARLLAAGKMTPAGMRRVAEAKANGMWQVAIEREQVDIIPEALERALLEHPGALAAYRALPDSRKKQYLYLLQTAKREETKLRRIQKIVAEVRNP